MECFNDELTTQKLTINGTTIITSDTTAYALTLNKTVVAGGTENLLKCTISDSDASLNIRNTTSTDSVFIPQINATQPTNATTGLSIQSQVVNSGTAVCMLFDARASGAALTTRPLFHFRNFTTVVMGIDYTGNVGIGIGGTAATEKLEVGGSLKVSGTTSVFKPPKLTTTQRNALTPESGDMIYNTTTNKHQGYDGTNWNDLY